MGTLTSVLGTVIGAATQSAQSSQSLQNLEQSQALEKTQLTANALAKKEQIALETKIAEDDRKDALKRSVAKQKASFGAQGVGSVGGSSQAVLLGITEESEEERIQREALDALKVSAIDLDLAQEKSLNILQREQLEEQNQINGITGIIGNIF